jgi:putative flippase GtrA
MKPSGIFCADWTKKKLVTFHNHGKIIEFFLFGILSSVVDISLLLFFTEGLGIWYLYSAALSYCCGILASYILNKYLTFKDGSRNYIVQFTSFAGISFSCFLVNICMIWLAVELFSLDYLTAKIIATICSFSWNYFGQSRITFRAGR